MKQNSLQYQQEIYIKHLKLAKDFTAWFEANSHGFVENEVFYRGVPKGTGQSVWRRTVFTGL